MAVEARMPWCPIAGLGRNSIRQMLILCPATCRASASQCGQLSPALRFRSNCLDVGMSETLSGWRTCCPTANTAARGFPAEQRTVRREPENKNCSCPRRSLSSPSLPSSFKRFPSTTWLRTTGEEETGLERGESKIEWTRASPGSCGSAVTGGHQQLVALGSPCCSLRTSTPRRPLSASRSCVALFLRAFSHHHRTGREADSSSRVRGLRLLNQAAGMFSPIPMRPASNVCHPSGCSAVPRPP